MMRQTSLDAYEELRTRDPPNISTRRRQVYDIIISHEPIDNLSIAQRLNLPINCITGRTNELVKAEVVTEVGRTKNSYNRDVILWGTC